MVERQSAPRVISLTRGGGVKVPLSGLSSAQSERRTVMIDATYLKAHRTASSLRVKKGVSGD